MDRAGNFWERLTTSRLKEDTHAFLSVLDDVFCACTILNPGITREDFPSEGTFIYL